MEKADVTFDPLQTNGIVLTRFFVFGFDASLCSDVFFHFYVYAAQTLAQLLTDIGYPASAPASSPEPNINEAFASGSNSLPVCVLSGL